MDGLITYFKFFSQVFPIAECFLVRVHNSVQSLCRVRITACLRVLIYAPLHFAHSSSKGKIFPKYSRIFLCATQNSRADEQAKVNSRIAFPGSKSIHFRSECDQSSTWNVFVEEEGAQRDFHRFCAVGCLWKERADVVT